MELLQKFWQQPYEPGMDAFHWFLFVGLLLTIAILWTIILNAIRG